MMFRRQIEDDLPRTSFFLFGPRLTGKSTLLRAVSSVLTLDLLDPEEQLAFTRSPNLLAERAAAVAPRGTIIIDEVQRVPKLLDVVHGLMERSPGLRFIMSGSSARKLRHGASNLLAGRALYRTLHPLTAIELGDRFRLDWALSYGTLPKVWTHLLAREAEPAQELLRSYVITYLREEVKAEAIVRNLQGFQNFLDVAAAQFAAQVNLTGVARDCMVAYTTVREFYSILEDTLLGFFLEPYARSARKRMSHQPRFYFFDNGVTRALLGSIRVEPAMPETGRLFEQWFIQEVYRINQYQRKDWKLCFWRTSHGAEVDLLIEANGKILAAIECKYRKRIAGADLSGLRAFHADFPHVPCTVVAPVTHPLRIDFVNVLSPLEMLKVISRL